MARHTIALVANQSHLDDALCMACSVRTKGRWASEIILLTDQSLPEDYDAAFTYLGVQWDIVSGPPKWIADRITNERYRPAYMKLHLFTERFSHYDFIHYFDCDALVTHDLNPWLLQTAYLRQAPAAFRRAHHGRGLFDEELHGDAWEMSPVQDRMGCFCTCCFTVNRAHCITEDELIRRTEEVIHLEPFWRYADQGLLNFIFYNDAAILSWDSSFVDAFLEDGSLRPTPPNQPWMHTCGPHRPSLPTSPAHHLFREHLNQLPIKIN